MAKKAAKKPAGTVFFSMEYQIGSGSGWTQRKASVHNDRSGQGEFVLFTSTVRLNHEPRYFEDMGEAIAAGMTFVQEGR